MVNRQLTVSSLSKKDEGRFWEKVKRGADAECWLWLGAKSRTGYGRFKVGRRVYYAHRVAFALHWGDSPDYLICHRCDSPSCVNPAHLYDQTQQENLVEASNRGRLHTPTRQKKPRPDFPLFVHQSGGGRWCKKVGGRFHYFGSVKADPDGQIALGRWLAEKDYLLSGREVPEQTGGLTIRGLVNAFLTAKQERVQTGELVPRTWQDYHKVCGRVVDVFGRDRVVSDLGPQDFARLRGQLAKTLGPVSLNNAVQRVRVLFKWGFDQGVILSPVRYGQSFDRPSRKTLRKARHENGKKLFSAEEIRALIDAAGVHLRGMIYLGINAAMGNSDVGTLPRKAVNLITRWIDYPRPKTGVPRRCPLWQETVAALRASLEARPTPGGKAHAGLFFLTRTGESWGKATTDNPVSKEFAKVIHKLKLQGGRRGFYSLRHTFRTVADGAKDRTAARVVMGHAESASDMDAAYIEDVDDTRLLAVTEHVRNWLFGVGQKQ